MKFPACILLIALFFSCADKAGKPQYLSQNKMREVMWDMIRADQYVSDFLLKDSTKKKKQESEKLYDEIFHIHQITEPEFKRSFDYYTSRPDLFKPIVDSLAKRKNDVIPFFGHPGTRLNKDSLIKARRNHSQK